MTRPFNGAIIAAALLPHVRNYRPDIVLSYFIYPAGFAAVRIAKAIGVPSVLTAVGSDLNRIPDPFCRILTQSALHNADFVSTVSADLRKTAIKLGADPDHCRTKLNGCDTSVFHPKDRLQARQDLGLDPEAEIATYVGRLDIRKGLVELIAAAAQLRSQRPRLRCYLVGDGRDKRTLLQAIARHNASSWITIVPACTTQQVAVWMAASNVVALPSYAEGCPNVVIEALAAGRPVVGTNVGGIPELMDNSCGRLILPRNVQAIVAALNDVLSQTWDANEISTRHGRSWSNVADDLYQVLEETIARRR